MIVCLCKAVNDRSVRQAIAEGASSVDAVARATGAGTCCGACRPAIAGLVAEAEAAAPRPATRPRPARLPLLQELGPCELALPARA